MTLEVGYHSFEGIPIEQLESLETLEDLAGDGYILLPYYDRFSGARIIPFSALLKLVVTRFIPVIRYTGECSNGAGTSRP